MDVDELTDALLGYMEDFRQVAEEGTVEEKRRFVRSFVNVVELDPARGKGRAELLSLPKETALADISESAVSSFKVVAGACYAAIHNVLAQWLVRRWKLSRKGRRSVTRR